MFKLPHHLQISMNFKKCDLQAYISQGNVHNFNNKAVFCSKIFHQIQLLARICAESKPVYNPVSMTESVKGAANVAVEDNMVFLKGRRDQNINCPLNHIHITSLSACFYYCLSNSNFYTNVLIYSYQKLTLDIQIGRQMSKKVLYYRGH